MFAAKATLPGLPDRVRHSATRRKPTKQMAAGMPWEKATSQICPWVPIGARPGFSGSSIGPPYPTSGEASIPSMLCPYR